MRYLLKCFFILFFIRSILAADMHAQMSDTLSLHGLDPERSLSQYHINSWTSDQGLPTQGVNGIIQNDAGYMLLSTFEGLLQFDGIDFKNILPKRINRGYGANTFKYIYKASNGKIWIAVNGSGLASFDNNHWEFFTRKNGLPSNVINAIVLDNQKKLWVGTSNGVSYKASSDKEFKNIGISEHLKNVPINEIVTDSFGNLWFATAKGLIKTDSNGNLLNKFSTEDGLGSNNVLSLHSTPNNDIWIGTEYGLRLLKSEAVKNSVSDSIYYKDIIMLLGVATPLNNKSIYDIFKDDLNNVWIGTNKGLFRYNNRHIGIESITENSKIPQHQVTDITQDNQGNIWVSTYRNGFYQLVQGKFITYSTAQGITGKTVYSLAEIKPDSFLIATSNGVTQYNKEWKFTPLKLNNKPFLQNKEVRDIIKDSKGNIWFAANGLYMLEPDKTLRTYSTENHLLSNYIRCLYEDKQGNIWIGTDEGLNKYHDGNFESFSTQQGLSNNRIHSIFQDSKERIWISTEDGLNTYLNGKFENIYAEDGLAGNVIFKIYEDQQGVLWVGTNGGISIIKDDSIKSIPRKLALPINAVFDFIEDKEGYFWIPNNQGIYKIDKEQVIAIANGGQITPKGVLYKKGDGMLVNACTANARSIMSTDGAYWFPTPDGVTVVPKPVSLEVNEIPPKIIIESVKLNGKEFPFSETLVLPPGEHQLSIKYTGLDYHAPERVTFSYGLSDFLNMTTPNYKREAVFTNIPPGQYTFNLVAFNHDNIQSNYAFQIIQKAELYNKPWFQALLVIIVFAIIWMFVKFSLNAEKRKNNLLEEKVEERTLEIKVQKELLAKRKKEVEDKNQALEKNNQQLILINKEKNHLIGIVAHDLKSPLNHIIGLINIIQISANNLNEEQKEYIEHILDATNKLSEMITHILDMEVVDSGNLKINLTDIELYSLLEGVIHNHHNNIEQKKMELVFDHNGHKFPIKADEKIVTQIFDNLISNAIKFTPIGKKIFVRVQETPSNNVRIEVKDQGPGITTADMHKLFGKYQKLSARPTGGEHSTGLGLSIVKRYVEALGGKVWCESEPDQGANFIVELKKVSNQTYKPKEDILSDKGNLLP